MEQQDTTPNDILANTVAEALLSEGLVPEDKKDELLSKLKAGTAKQDDWNLWVDVATSPEEAEDQENG